MQYIGRKNVEGSEMVHFTKGKYKNRDKFVLCSDGVGALGEKEIEISLQNNENAKSLIGKAVNCDSSDNCTAIVLEM